VIRLSQPPNQRWQWQDVSQPGAGVPKDSSPFGYVDAGTGLDVVAYRDDEEGLRILQEGPAGWSHLSLTWATQQENPTPLAAAPIWGMARAGEEHRLFCLDHRQDIRMFFRGGDGAWHTRSLTEELSLPPAGAVVVQRVYSVAGTELQWVLVFTDYEGLVWEVRSVGDGWTTELVQAEDMPLVGRHFLAAWSSDEERHVAYTADNGNIQLLSRPLSDVVAGGWRVRNLSRDSGAI
jgi:hypothetical protein